MDLTVVWFLIVSVLFIGFFFLEGFDFGVGILLLFLGKNDDERRIIINSIGPFWDGNEVWLITAGGAIFAAFPNWYATMFSGFYLALLVVLVALILRGVYFEFRSKKQSKIWRRNWDYIMSVSSIFLAILWGVALANLIKGVPIDNTMNYIGGFFDLISVYTIFAGITAFCVFTFHGAIFLSLKTTGVIEERAKRAAFKFGVFSIISSIVLMGLSYLQTDVYKSRFALVAAIAAFVFQVLSLYMIKRGKLKLSLLSNGLSIALGVGTLFLGLFPRVMISSLGAQFDLTIYNASSSQYTLALMTKVAMVFVPIVLGYQGWTYWIFRKRVTVEDLEY